MVLVLLLNKVTSLYRSPFKMPISTGLFWPRIENSFGQSGPESLLEQDPAGWETHHPDSPARTKQRLVSANWTVQDLS